MLEQLASAALDALGRRGVGVAYAMAGGGSAALAALAGREGASKVLIGGQLAYSRAAALALRGIDQTEGYASAAMALDLAHAALESADAFDDRRRELRIGIGMASALATSPPRSGSDRAYLAVAGNGPAQGWRLTLDAWPGDRGRQEMLTGAAALLAAWRGAGCGASEPPTPAGLSEALVEKVPGPAYWVDRVARGRWPWARFHQAGGWSAPGVVPAGVLAGSFNPLHAGHLGLADAAGRHIGAPVEFELSLQNVDKAPLDLAVAVERIGAVGGQGSLIIDGAATFPEKSDLYPGAVFVVGADTAARIVDPKYYGGDPAKMRVGLDAIRANANRFLVSGRRIGGRYIRFDALDLASAADLFAELPESAFRMDISSSQIRAGRASPPPGKARSGPG